MDFFKLIKSLDELLFEVLGWLLFYPITLWRVLVHPVRTLHYAEQELSKDEDDQFRDTVSPPLFLFLTLILVHLVELAWVGQSAVVVRKGGLNSLVANDTSVIVLRALVFGLFPLLLARQFARAKGLQVNRETIKTAFYAQCYATAPFAVLISASTLVVRKMGGAGGELGLGLTIAALIWLGLIETEWFRTRLSISRRQAFLQSSKVMALGVLVLFVVGAFLE